MSTAVFLFTFPCQENSRITPTLELHDENSSTAYAVAANEAQRALCKTGLKSLAEQVEFLKEFTGLTPSLPFRDGFGEITADIFTSKYPKYVYAYFNEGKSCLETATGEYLGDVVVLRKNRTQKVPIKITNSANGFEYQGYWHKSHGNHCRIELLFDILEYEAKK